MKTAEYLAALRGADHFEAAAVACLRRLMGLAERAIQEGYGLFRRSSVLRAMLHVRPGEGYSGLYVLEQGDDLLTAPGDLAATLPSAGAWDRVRKDGAAVALDVGLGWVGPVGTEPDTSQAPPDSPAVSVSTQTRSRLMERRATHVLVLPLRTADRLVGMASVEGACVQATGTPYLWADCVDAMEEAAWLAAPSLAGLPTRSRTPSPGIGGGSRPAAEPTDPLLPVVGRRSRPILQALRAFAASDETILLSGETGVGKSRLARWCHSQSARAGGPFEVLDLHTVPPDGQMAELVGWRRGAFTGAASDHAGYIARAQGGTLFLDEIDKLSLEAQAGLLTLIEDRRYRVLGDSGAAREADLRFIAGTNVDLTSAVAAGRFREDLYYRLDVLSVEIPALRDRRDEIDRWASHMLERVRQERGDPGPVAIQEAASQALQERTWPGNLRELDNALRRAYALARVDADGAPVAVTVKHLGPARPARPGVGTPAQALAAASGALAARLRAGPIDLSEIILPEALFGFLLAEAVEATGDREEAMRLVGREELIRNRNHHKALRRAVGRALELCEALGEDPPASLTALVGPGVGGDR